MSFPDPSARKPIPTGILVAKRSTATSPEKPTPKRKLNDARQLPWLLIAVGGSIAWGMAILTIAICAHSQASQPALVEPIVFNKPNAPALVPGQPAPFVAPEVGEFRAADNERKPNEPAPKLVRHLAPRNDDMPPELVVFPEDAKPAAAPVPVKAFRKDIDLDVFANCEQIGTNVLFVKDPPEAFKMAFDKRKLVFVVHLSGNLEDKDFT